MAYDKTEPTPSIPNEEETDSRRSSIIFIKDKVSQYFITHIRLFFVLKVIDDVQTSK